MKKISVIMIAVLLTLCGVRTMASLLSLTGTSSGDKVTIPSVSVNAGSTFTVPVSLENSNSNYVAFEMNILLPQGVTPVFDGDGYVAIEKTNRLNSSHDFSTTYDAANNTIKLVCSSMRNPKIQGTSGELFYITLMADASMKTGDYQLALSNVLFTTSSSAPEGAVGYTLSNAVGILSVSGSGAVGGQNYLVLPSMSVQAGETFTLPVSLENSNTNFVAFEMNILLQEGITPVFDGDGYVAIEKTSRLNSSHDFSTTYDAKNNSIKLVCSSMRNPKIQGTSGELFYITLKAGASIKSGDYQIAFTNVLFTTSSSAPEGAVGYTLRDATTFVSVTGTSALLNIHVAQPGTLATLIADKGFGLSDVVGLTVSGYLNENDMSTIQQMYSLEMIDMSETNVTDIVGYWFRYHTNLNSLVLPKNLQSIGYQAFYSCLMLMEIALPESLQTIGYMAFGNCPSLRSITCNAFAPVSQYDRFMENNYANLCTLYVPAISVDVYKNTWFWNEFQIVGTNVLPENITVTSQQTIDWPDGLSMDYKPNVRIDHMLNQTYEGCYGSLTMNGNSTMSMSDFSIIWDPYYASQYTEYNSATGNYNYRRYAYATLMANTTMRADRVNVEVQAPTFRWDFLSFPFDVKVSDIANLNQTNAPLVIRRYDGKNRADGKMSETWVNMNAESTLEAGKGYIWQSASGDQDLDNNAFLVPAINNVNKNNIFAKNDITVQLDEFASEFSQNRSWNLIGNPYPAFYDIRFMQTTAPITIWNGYYNVYEAYMPSDDSYILNPGQAFFIQRPWNQESITFLKDGRQLDLNVREFITDNIGRRAAANSERYVFNLLLTGSEETQADRTRIVVNPEALLDYEAGRDASKFMSHESNAAQLYTVQKGVRFAINERPLNDGIVELGLSLSAAGSYTIALNTKVEGEVYLIDRTAGTMTRLDGGEAYTFQADRGVIEGRFAIQLGDGDVTGIKSIDNSTLTNDSYYNLNGIRVQQPKKGLYILNGKKAVVR